MQFLGRNSEEVCNFVSINSITSSIKDPIRRGLSVYNDQTL